MNKYRFCTDPRLNKGPPNKLDDVVCRFEFVMFYSNCKVEKGSERKFEWKKV